jgi:hypothetical protein
MQLFVMRSRRMADQSPPFRTEHVEAFFQAIGWSTTHQARSGT